MPKQTRAPRLTVGAEWLNDAADSLEREARESLTAWIILGLPGRYAENIGKAAALRHAATIKNISARREFLRHNGVPA